MDRKAKIQLAKKIAAKAATIIILGVAAYLERRMIAYEVVEETEEKKEKDIIVIRGEIVDD